MWLDKKQLEQMSEALGVEVKEMHVLWTNPLHQPTKKDFEMLVDAIKPENCEEILLESL